MKIKMFLINEKLCDLMYKLDLCDNGNKVFGDFYEFDANLKSNIKFPPFELFRELSKLNNVGFFALENFVYIKQNYFGNTKILMFSDGKKFLCRTFLEGEYEVIK